MKPLPWWLTGGTEQCGSCVQWHQFHAVYRCQHCDGPVCTGCALVGFSSSTRTLLCPACGEEAEEDD